MGIRRFYIWFNIHLIGGYQKLKEPKVLGTFGGEQLIEPRRMQRVNDEENLEVFQNSW
jgi:hypothetical protein